VTYNKKTDLVLDTVAYQTDLSDKKHVFYKLTTTAAPISNRQFSDLLFKVFECSGYVAGGAALSYLCSINKIMKGVYSDIDIWFENPIDLENFLCYVRSKRSQYYMEKSIKDFAYNIFLTEHEKYIASAQSPFTKPAYPHLQVIKQCRPIDEVLSKFDIVNCKVAFNHEKLIYDNRVLSLIHNSSIDIDSHFSTEWTLTRLSKYIRNYRITSMQDNAKEFVRKAFNELIIENKLFKKEKILSPTWTKFKNDVIMKSFNNEELLFLATIEAVVSEKNINYTSFMKHLINPI
jgi:hypothetical protein